MRWFVAVLALVLAPLLMPAPVEAHGVCPVAQIPLISTSGRTFTDQRKDGIIYTWGNPFAQTWWVHVEAGSGKKIATVSIIYKRKSVYAIPNAKMWEKQTPTREFGRPLSVTVCLWP